MSRRKLWYQESDERDQAQTLVNAAKALNAEQGEHRRRRAEDALTLWSGSSRHNLSGMNPLAVLGLLEEGSSYNVVQAIVDTKANATLRNEVRPLFITEGGDSELREKVSAMQEAADGQTYALGLEGELEEQACWNGYIFGSGGIEFWSDTASSRVMVTPTWDWEYFVSRQEARNGDPQQLFSRHVMPRDVLLSFLADQPKAVIQAVEDAPAASWQDTRTYDATEPGRVADLVVIYKGWHLPSKRVNLSDPRAFGRTENGNRGKANHDGLHMVCIEGAPDAPPLIVRPWPHDYYPVSWFRPNRVPGSFWGRGEPEILAPKQIEANRWNQRIYGILDHHARPGLILSKGANISPSQITNSPYNIWHVTGSPSQAILPLNYSAVPADLIRRLEQLPAAAREQRGMSEMSMAARKPAGINHEPGLAYLQNTETIRHTAEFRAWERFKIECSKNIIRCLRELAELDPNYEVVFESDDRLKRVKWREIDVDASKYQIRTKGTNLFAKDPAQQADQIMDLVDRGALPPDAVFDAVKSPDLQMLAGDRNIMAKNIERRLDAVVKGPEYTFEMMPDPYLDLQLAKRLGVQRKNKLEYNEEGADKIQRVIDFLTDVDKLLGLIPGNTNGGAPPANDNGAPALPNNGGNAPGPAGVSVPPKAVG